MTARINYEEAIKNGDALGWQGRWEESVNFFLQALAEQPDDALTHSSLGAAYIHTGRYGEALEEYKAVLKVLPQDVLALARVADCLAKLGRMEDCAATYLELGEVYMQQRNYLRATDSWRKIVSLLPEYEEARVRLAEALDRGGDVEEAAEQYAALAFMAAKTNRERAEELAWRALELDPNNSDAKRLLGTRRTVDRSQNRTAGPTPAHPPAESLAIDELLVEDQGPDRAPQAVEVDVPLTTAEEIGEEEADGLYASDSLSVSVLRKLAAALDSSEELMARGLYLAALDECYDAMRLAPTYPPIHSRIAEIHAARGREDQAVEKYSTLTGIYLLNGRVDEALEARGKMVALSPDDDERKEEFIRFLLEHGREEEAVDQQLRLAEGRARLRQYNRASADFREAIRMAPSSALPHLRFGRMLGEMGRAGDAMREYEEAASLEPNNAEPMLMLSIANRLSGQFEDAASNVARLFDLIRDNPGKAEWAAQEYKAVAEVHPDVADFFALAGLLFFTFGKTDEAIPCLERALDGATDGEDVRIALGHSYLAQRMHAKAVEVTNDLPAQQAAEFMPAFRQEAETLGREGRWADAVGLLEALKQWDPRDDGVYIKLAEAHFRQGNLAGALREFDTLGQMHLSQSDKKRAIAIFQVMKQLGPRTALPYLRLGDVYAGEGMNKEAITEYEVLADIHLKLGQVANGIAILKRIVNMDPEAAEGHLHLGEALFAAKQYADAAQEFRRLLEIDPANAIAQSRLAVIRSTTGG